MKLWVFKYALNRNGVKFMFKGNEQEILYDNIETNDDCDFDQDDGFDWFFDYYDDDFNFPIDDDFDWGYDF